jgi:peptidylprolyl isomerase
MTKRVLSLLTVALMMFVGVTYARAENAAPAAAPSADQTPAPTLDPENTLYMDLPFGRVVIELRPDKAPKTVARIKELVRQHFYDGLAFHRVIPGFMAQGGDPKGDGTGGSGQTIPAEFNDMHHLRGTISMARSSDPNSADSQFFICFAPAPFLDGQYTAFGRVVSGMEYVDMIKKGNEEYDGEVQDPTRIVKMQVMADAIKK